MARKILIVDDQEDILLILEREFRRVPGFSVSSTSKVASVIPLIAEKQINLVISDVRMGRDSGFDLVREINRTYTNVGTILMTAYRSPSNHKQAEELGVIAFLEKPFQIPKLIETVTAYFQKLENPAPAAAIEERTDFSRQTNSLVHFKLQDLVQLFCLNGRNIVITVTPAPGLPVGEIYIQRGRLIHTDYNDKTGDEAFLDLMQLPDPDLAVNDWTALVPVTVSSSWEQLLLQSAIHSDHRQPGRQAHGTG
jgi:DNA-binding response OmpR family regulator